MKYSASPAAANPARAFALDRRNPNALRDELIRHLNEDATMSSFDFGLQFLDVPKHDSIRASAATPRSGSKTPPSSGRKSRRRSTR